MGMDINQLIQAALLMGQDGAIEKIAQEAGGRTCDTCGKPAMEGSKFCRECAEKAASKEEQAAGSESSSPEKTSSARVMKLASAVRFIVDNFHDVGRPVGRLKKMAQPSITETASDTGPGKGPTALQTTLESPTPGEAPEGFGEAKVDKIEQTPPLEVGAQPKSAPNAMGTNEKMMHPEQPQVFQQAGTGAGEPKNPVVKKGSATVASIKEAMMRKAAQDGEPSISTPKTMTPTQPEDQTTEGSRPAEVTSQEAMVASNEAAINATKREAKAVPKKRMGEVLNEPAQTKSTDSALDKALGADVVNEAGAKVAHARETLQKIASQGCTCETEQLEQGSCGHCKIASRIERRSEEQAGALWEAARSVPSHPGRSGL